MHPETPDIPADISDDLRAQIEAASAAMNDAPSQAQTDAITLQTMTLEDLRWEAAWQPDDDDFDVLALDERRNIYLIQVDTKLGVLVELLARIAEKLHA